MHRAKVAFMTKRPDSVTKPLLEVAPAELFVYLVDNQLPDEVKAPQIKDADFIIVWPPDISVELVRTCRNLKLIQLLSAGYDRMDVKAVSSLGIPVANNGGANAVAVAEFTVALMLCWRNVCQNKIGLSCGLWELLSWKREDRESNRVL